MPPCQNKSPTWKLSLQMSCQSNVASPCSLTDRSSRHPISSENSYWWWEQLIVKASGLVDSRGQRSHRWSKHRTGSGNWEDLDYYSTHDPQLLLLRKQSWSWMCDTEALWLDGELTETFACSFDLWPSGTAVFRDGRSDFCVHPELRRKEEEPEAQVRPGVSPVPL